MSGVFLPLGLSITDLNVSLFTSLNLEGKMFNIIALQARMGQPHHPKASTRTEAGFRGPKPGSPVHFSDCVLSGKMLLLLSIWGCD